MYKKTNWKKGDVISPEKLNKIEKALEEVYKLVARLEAEKEVGKAEAEDAEKEPTKSVKPKSAK